MDVVIACDLRFPGGTSTSVVEEVKAGASAGYSVGLMHLDSTSVRPDHLIHPEIRRQIDLGAASLLLAGQKVTAKLLVIKHPTIFQEPLGGRLPITAEHVVMVVGQVPSDGAVHYDPALVDAHVVAAVGRRAVWAPVSPIVRRHLGPASDAAQIRLSADDWVETIDPEGWHTDRSLPVDRERPVIGRHSRPSRLKWPASADELLDAYPDDGTVRVRVLGGIDGIDELLGRTPDHWEVLPFGAMSAREFLAGIDVFVFFHHPDLIEAFGRTILEALASGAVVVLPAHFEPLFGPACLYSDAAGVKRIAERIHADADARLRQSEIGLEVLRRRFSHEAHVSRVRELIGSPGDGSLSPLPAPDPALIPPGQRRQLPTVLVAALGASRRQLGQAIEALAVQRGPAVGFIPVLVTTERPPKSAAAAGIQVEVVKSRRRWSKPDDQWPEYAASRLRFFARKHGAHTVTVLDLSHPDAWISLRCIPQAARRPG